MDERITCRSCGNPCRAPGRPGRYLCPRCRRPLACRTAPRSSSETIRPLPIGAPIRRLADAPIRSLLVSRVLSRLAPIACILGVLMVARRAAVMPAVRPVASSAVLVPAAGKPYRSEVERIYRFRIRQLKLDLNRDRNEYLLLSRLGVLHLRLARHAPSKAQAERDYQSARGYFERAAQCSRTRREYEWSMSQREACADRAPVTDAGDPYLYPDMVATPPPPSVDMDGQLLMRVQFLEGRLTEIPRNARLLARLGLTYVRLSQAIDAHERRGGGEGKETERRGNGEPGTRRTRSRRSRPVPHSSLSSSLRLSVSPSLAPQRWPWAGPAGDWTPDAASCRRLAGQRLGEALRWARCREIRAESYRSLAELHRAEGDLAGAVLLLRRVVSLQPNNWPAQLHLATLLGRLGHANEARVAEASAEHWRTPEWL